MQAYGGSYSSVTYSCNIRNEIGVMRFPCNEIAMSDDFEKQNLATTVPKAVHANDLSLEICILLVVKSLHSSQDCWPCSHLCVINGILFALVVLFLRTCHSYQLVQPFAGVSFIVLFSLIQLDFGTPYLLVL